MSYESMGIRELQDECKRRGLPSGRSKAELIQRLTQDDATNDGDTGSEPDTATVPDVPSENLALVEDGEPQAPAGDSTSPPVFRKTFPAEPGGPDEETHLANRQSTIQAAIDAGLTPRGDARLAETSDGVWVYEVLVRRVT